MSGADIITTLNVLIKLGLEIKTRLASLNHAAEDLQLLTTNLVLLLTVFEDPINEDLIKAHVSEFVYILDVLQGIAQSCTKCAKALDIDLARATIVTRKAESSGKKLVRRIWIFNKIPDLLAEIQRKAEQLQQGRTTEKEAIDSTTVVKISTANDSVIDLELSSDFANIDKMVGNLINECKHLQERLQEATLVPDTSAIQDYQAQNPEAATFWKDRFQKNELNASAIRYETLYVSWARFIHEVEASFVLKRIPTGVFYDGNIDLVRQQGSRYHIDHSSTRRLSSIRPLWLPALRTALDPLNKGYVKPQDYFNLLQDSSLSETLRKLALDNAGYGIIIECERASADLPLPAEIESPTDHVGWTTAQIVAVPTANELGIVTDREVMESSSQDLFACFSDSTQDVHVYVRYLQTGQIERKSLSMQVRPMGGISVGAVISIRHELESGAHAWSNDLCITEFKACFGGQYMITAGVGLTATVFSTRPLKNSFNDMLRTDDNYSSLTMPELDCMILGPSKVFTNPPKVGEKVQIEHDGLWYDSRVTVVDGDEIEYIDWECLSEQITTSSTESQDDSTGSEEDCDGFFFPEEQLTQLGKGTRRLWRPWKRNINKYDVRPYRCFHIGDSIEAPVMYPDFQYHYHVVSDSQLYLPARIIDIWRDQYVIEFSPALSVHRWWPGRIPKGKYVELVPGSGMKVENPVDFNRLTIDMDLVRPFSAGPRPVLGVQSAKPPGWSSFQGVHLRNLEDLLERSLWNNDRSS